MTTPRHPVTGQFTTGDWSALCGALPSHQDALMDGYHPQPTIAEQNSTHGAGMPAVDRGWPSDKAKYAGTPQMPTQFGYGGSTQ